ncbi:S1C family serine protease [Zhenhengia yiwuensis]|jgi:serine protease Do|uniref:Trypsin-like peptidase domain-containing protein n=1 Tax=Zhenhengia yiwuensis TaxID=2763666 RepID=A0A926IG67_9FIRM|nr:trypsin-like peptidase domain-containing protein [Zhenhengia yiwuensis]MBC8581256.1 trypsin-like peptidase domain-containing protein [Zhenhengia yiwuensis]MBS5800623.1 trypsin-like peptidase domain-containing protein [Clostridiales bacterium]
MQDNNLNNPNEQDSIIDVPYTSEPKPEDEMNQEEATYAKETAQPRANKDIPLPPYIEPNGTYYHETIKEKKRGSKASKKQGPGGFGKFAAGLVIVSMVGGVSLGAGYAFTAPLANKLYEDKYGITREVAEKNEVTPYAQSTGYVTPLSVNNSIADIAESVGPSVVSIKNNKLITTWAGEFNQEGLGSGVIFKVDDQKVYIISNAHVVEGATTLTVTFLGNSKVPANIVGYDTITDIAVVAVDKADIPADIVGQIKPAILGDNDKLRVGDLAVAIGTPIDEAYENTVTVGVVSALDREISLTDQKLNLIQTDAAINPGNSGGALVGPTGEVVGINTIKLVDSEIEGMGFAIPINDVKPIVEELMTTGSIARPVLGIVGENLTEELGNYWDIPVGIMVVQVQPGTSADVAGIKQGDVILEFDGQRISTMEELKELLLDRKVGDQVKVKVVRGSQKLTLDVKLQGKAQPAVQ